MRHNRFIRQQLHEMNLSQRLMKKQLNEMKNNKIDDRLHSLEINQRQLTNGNFNLSRQVSSLNKLHSSLLELLEDVEGIQNKFDKTIPDVKREISKIEFTSAQLVSEQNVLREEGRNAVKSIQAISVSVSALQDDRDVMRGVQKQVQKIQLDVKKIESQACKIDKVKYQILFILIKFCLSGAFIFLYIKKKINFIAVKRGGKKTF